MDKISKWQKSMMDYYQTVSEENFKRDLQIAGFTVNGLQNMDSIRHWYSANSEVAAALQIDSEDDKEEIFSGYTVKVKMGTSI